MRALAYAFAVFMTAANGATACDIRGFVGPGDNDIYLGATPGDPDFDLGETEAAVRFNGLQMCDVVFDASGTFASLYCNQHLERPKLSAAAIETARASGEWPSCAADEEMGVGTEICVYTDTGVATASNAYFSDFTPAGYPETMTFRGETFTRRCD